MGQEQLIDYPCDYHCLPFDYRAVPIVISRIDFNIGIFMTSL